MLDEQTQSTDVSAGTPSGEASSSEATAPSVSPSGDGQAPAPGGDTAQLDTAGQTDSEAGTVDPTQDDPLKDVPSLEELEQNKSQQYAQALINLRTAYEARKEEIQRLQQETEPLRAVTQLGEPEVIQSIVEAYNGLFTPVVNPETKQPVLNEQGFPQITTLPFIEKVDGENPGLAEQLLVDLLRHAPEGPDGAKVPLWQRTLEAWGLDPNRLQDYRNIDALVAPSTGEITPEELETIPKEFQETYKSLPPGVRQDLQAQDEETREFNLEAHKDRFDRKASEAERQKQEQQAQQQREQEVRVYVEGEQDKYVSQQLQEGNAAIMDDLASKVTFGDEQTNTSMRSVISSLLFSLRDPDFRQANHKELAAMGIQLGEDFDQTLAAAETHLRNAKKYELFKQNGLAQQSRTEARNAKNAVLAKLSPLALRVAKLMGGQLVQRAQDNGKALDGATRTRPIPDGSETEETGGLLPPGMRANDPQAGIYLARQAGVLGR